ncbi:hypothetical protein AVBRAN12654_03215 [Campylobacter sp. RM12654]|uniref:FtsK/SpoIIIE domain-containing protein n=2 Tax=unclassified Campylobacter TaxID=2593542 RepID=UPI0030142B2C|nr:hypothetical protein [Campylobacter sp. RM12654]
MSYINEVIFRKIENEKSQSDEIAKVLLEDFHKTTYVHILNQVEKHHPDILVLCDKRLELNSNASNIKSVDDFYMASARNEEIEDLHNYNLILFLVASRIDTLGDIKQITKEDLKDDIGAIVDLLGLSDDDAARLKNICNEILKKINHINIYDIDSFLLSIINLINNEACSNQEAIGMSLDKLGMFRYRKCFHDYFKTNKNLAKSIKTLKDLSNAINKEYKNLNNEDLANKFFEDDERSIIKEEFDMLDSGKKELIKQFIYADKNTLNKDKIKFATLDWADNKIELLFDKLIIQPNLSLYQQTIDYLEQKDITLQSAEVSLLKTLSTKKTNKNLEMVEEFYDKYKGYISENLNLDNKWKKMLYPKTIKVNNFLVGLVQLINMLECSLEQISISLDKKQKKAIFSNYNKDALRYLKYRFLIIEKFSNVLKFDEKLKEFLYSDDFDSNLNTQEKDKTTRGKKTELDFKITITYKDDRKITKYIKWKFETKSIVSKYCDSVDNILHILKEKKIFSPFYIANRFLGKNNLRFTLSDMPFGMNYKKYAFNFTNKYKKYFSNPDEFNDIYNDFIEKFIGFLEHSFFSKDGDMLKICQDLNDSYINCANYIYTNYKNDDYKNDVIKSFISIFTLQIQNNNNFLVIPSYHPLRLLSYCVKIKKIASVIDSFKYDKENIAMQDAYYNDLDILAKTPYYFDFFSLSGDSGDKNKLLVPAEHFDEHSLYENIPNENEKNIITSEYISTLEKSIKEYLELYLYRVDNLKVLLHETNSSILPLEILKKLLDVVEDGQNYELFLNGDNASKIRKIYSDILKNTSNDDIQKKEISFLSNVRLQAFHDSFDSLDRLNYNLDIALLYDFFSSRAKIEYKNLPEANINNIALFDFHPTIWSNKRFITENEKNISRYLTTPVKTQVSRILDTLILSLVSDNKGDYDYKLPTISFTQDQNIKETISKIHQKTEWVISVDSLTDKRVLNACGARVIKYKKARNLNKVLSISSHGNFILLKKTIKAKIQEIIEQNIAYDENIEEKLINLADEIAGDIVLKATGKGSFANELLGLALSNYIIKNNSTNSAIIYLDNYSDWFLGGVDSYSQMFRKEGRLADLLAITPVFKDGDLSTLYVDVYEIKYCSNLSKRDLEDKSIIQTLHTKKQVEKIFSEDEYNDKDFCIARFTDLIIEEHLRAFKTDTNVDINSEQLRTQIRQNYKNLNFIVRGFSFIFVYDLDENIERRDCDGVVQYHIGKKAILNILNNIDKQTKLIDINYQLSEQQKCDKAEDIKNMNVAKNDDIKDFAVKECVDVQYSKAVEIDTSLIEQNIKNVLIHHDIATRIIDVKLTPNSIRFSLKPDYDWNITMFEKLDSVFLSMCGLRLLRVEVVPRAYDLVFQREIRDIVFYKDCVKERELENQNFNTKLIIGKSETNNENIYFNLNSSDSHALVAGMTKSGKSVFLNSLIIDLIRTNKPEYLNLILIDPKQVEFAKYENIPHLHSLVTQKEEAINTLNQLVEIMEQRYAMFKGVAKDINSYNKQTDIILPRIVVVFDEFADWMLDKDFSACMSSNIQSLSGKARAAGIHLIISTQRPDNTVVPPILRANLGAKFALRVDTEKNSNIILDEKGAEKLLGNGHMIAKLSGEKYYIQSAFLSDEDIDEYIENL